MSFMDNQSNNTFLSRDELVTHDNPIFFPRFLSFLFHLCSYLFETNACMLTKSLNLCSHRGFWKRGRIWCFNESPHQTLGRRSCANVQSRLSIKTISACANTAIVRNLLQSYLFNSCLIHNIMMWKIAILYMLRWA